MLQWFIRFTKFTEFPFHLGKTPLFIILIMTDILCVVDNYSQRDKGGFG